MSKRILSATALFVCMCLVGGALSLAVVSDAGACIRPACSGDCEPGPLGPLYYLSCISCAGCDDPTPYYVWECYGRCTGGGLCDCEHYGCWAGFNCD